MKEWQIAESAGIPLQTKDRMNNSIDVKLKYRFTGDDATLTQARKDYGDETAILNKTLVVEVAKTIFEEGITIEDSAHLVNAEHMQKFKTNVLAKLNDKIGKLFIIDDIVLGEVAFDGRVLAKIQATLDREEEEKEQASTLEIETMKFQEKTREAEQKSIASEYALTEKKNDTDAVTYDLKQKSDAKLYDDEQRAKGMAAVNVQLTPQYLKYIEAQATLAEANNWDGKRALTHQIVATPIANLTK